MKAEAKEESISGLPMCLDVTFSKVISESIVKIQGKAGDVNIKQIRVETIKPYSTGTSV